jgi:probable HAF family extracellular repeat protein
MNSKTSTRIIALTLLAALAIPVQLAAQETAKPHHPHQYHHYQIVDPGTFGGPNSYNESNPIETLISAHGAAALTVDTSVPDPLAPNCFLDCFVSDAVVWQHGVLTDLPALDPGYSSWADAINARGEVAGLSENGQTDPLTGNYESNAVLWKNGLINLGTLGGTQSVANAINDRGQVVGAALNAISDPFESIPLCNGCGTFAQYFNFVPAATQMHAFRWTEAKGMQDLGALGGPDSSASFVNERGQIAGEFFTSFTPNPSTGVPPVDPFFWENGKMVDIGTLGGTFGAPNWMNNRGQVVGYSNVAGDQNSHPFLWDKKVGLKDLGLLPGGMFGGANAINDEGEIVGGSDATGFFHAVLWKHGAITDLGTVAGDGCSAALWINSQGQIVGFGSADCFNEDHAGLSENGGPLVDLQTLALPGSGVTLTSAIFINDQGEIAARGVLPNGDQRAVLLIPCDENHAEVEGCDYSLVDASEPAEGATPLQVPSQPQRLPHSRPGNRFHISGRVPEGGAAALAVPVSPVSDYTRPHVFYVSLSVLTPSTVNPGGSSTSAVTAGISGEVAVGTAALACTVQPSPPLAPTCSISPASLSFQGTPATLTVSTVGPSAALSHRDHGLLYALWLPLIGLVVTGAGLGSNPNRHKGKLKRAALVCALFAGLTFPLACGGGGSSQRTPPGTYTINVTATAFIPVNTTSTSTTLAVQ